MRRLLTAALLCHLASATAIAGTASANLNVTATVNSNCIATTGAVSFGTYDPSSGSAKDASGSVTVTCTAGTTYTIALDAGANAGTGGDATTRQMLANASDLLPYTLYLDASRTTIWGDGANGTSVNPAAGSFTGDGSAQAHVAYGRITAGQYVAPGSYVDTVVATVTYN